MNRNVLTSGLDVMFRSRSNPEAGTVRRTDSCGDDLTENEKDAQCEEDRGECQSTNPQGFIVWWNNFIFNAEQMQKHGRNEKRSRAVYGELMMIQENSP